MSNTPLMQVNMPFSPRAFAIWVNTNALRIASCAFLWITAITYMVNLPLAHNHQLTLATTKYRQALETLQILPFQVANLNTLVQVFVFVSAGIITGLVWWRRGDDWQVQLLVSGGFCANLLVFNLPDLYEQMTWLTALFLTVGGAGQAMLLLALYIFPVGRFLNPWTRTLYFLLLPVMLFSSHYELLTRPATMLTWTNLLLMFALVVGLASLWVRYRRMTPSPQRVQMKWVVISICITTAGLSTFLLVVALLAFSEIDQSLYDFIERGALPPVTIYAPLACSSLALALAVLRYRMWEIDFAINRLLGYAVTALLLTIGGAAVILIGRIWVDFNVISVAALALALALYLPLKRRVQARIDRDVYRLRVDLDTLRRYYLPPAVMQPGSLTGTRLGDFALLDFVGKGAMSEVYKAYNDRAGQTVAIKILTQNHDGAAQQFAHEVQVLSALDHPNIVGLIGTGDYHGRRYLIMQYVDGQPLDMILSQRGRLSLSETQKVIDNIAEALDHAHVQGLVHRDIKPSNVMLQLYSTGVVRHAVLMDFGMASGETQTVTVDGTFGTIDYMAPEQIRSSGTVQAYADVYALGVLAYEMLTGERPFKGNPGQVLFAHLNQPPPDPSRLIDDLPPYVSMAVQRALSKSADDRYPTAGEFAAALRGEEAQAAVQL